jgi:hypothetical protein
LASPLLLFYLNVVKVLLLGKEWNGRSAEEKKNAAPTLPSSLHMCLEALEEHVGEQQLHVMLFERIAYDRHKTRQPQLGGR